MGRGDEFVTILRTRDPVRAEVIRDLLGQEGIPATIPGAHHNALLGAAGGLIEIRLQVRRSDSDQAAELIAALDDEDQVLMDDSEEAAELGRVDHEEPEDDYRRTAGPHPGEGPYRRAPRRRRPERPRLKRVASFLSLAITFGTGHIYARETVAGAVLLLAEIGIFVAGATRPALMWALPLLVLVDLVGSWRAVDRHNARRPLSPASQLVRAGGLCALAIGAALLVVPALADALRPDASAELPTRGAPPEPTSSDVVRELDPAQVLRIREGAEDPIGAEP